MLHTSSSISHTYDYLVNIHVLVPTADCHFEARRKVSSQAYVESAPTVAMSLKPALRKSRSCILDIPRHAYSPATYCSIWHFTTRAYLHTTSQWPARPTHPAQRRPTPTRDIRTSHIPSYTYTSTRHSSHGPMSASPPTSTRKPVTLQTLAALYRKNEPITMITAHDFPSAHVADQAGMDMVLVGDSLAMVALGLEDTSEVTVEDMLLHCRSVARGAKNAFVVCGTSGR